MDFDEDNGEIVNHAIELAKELMQKAAYRQGYRDAQRYVGWFLERCLERPVPPEYIPSEEPSGEPEKASSAGPLRKTFGVKRVIPTKLGGGRRVVIPSDMCREHGLESGKPLVLESTETGIVVRLLA